MRLVEKDLITHEAAPGFKVRSMSKTELAMAYAPNLTVQGAVNRLMQWKR